MVESSLKKQETVESSLQEMKLEKEDSQETIYKP
jgi:hypothetical protein